MSNIIYRVFIVLLILAATERIYRKIAELQKTAVYSTVTGYSSEFNQTDSTPNITAFNKQVADGMVAVSWYLYANGWTEGKCVWIDQVGERRIGDIMNRRLKGPRIDIWFHALRDAKEYGVKHLILVTLMKCSKEKMKSKNEISTEFDLQQS